MSGFNLEELLARGRTRGRLVHRMRDEAGHDLTVHECDGLRWFSADGEFAQSLMRLAAPAELVLPNLVAMLGALLWRPRPACILNLGLGGGAFERFFHARLPQCTVTSVERSPAVAELARNRFALPAGHPVVIEAAEDFLARNTARFDLVLCDLFAGETHPDCLFDPHFHADVLRASRTRGVLALNVSPTAEDDLVGILAALRQVFEWVMVAEIPAHGNVVVLAARRPPPPEATAAARAEALARELDLDPAQLLPGWERLPSRSEVMGELVS